MEGAQLHAVVFPYPGQGHINPLMQLAIRLASSHGFMVTFVTAYGNHKSIIDSWSKMGIARPWEQGTNIRMVGIPDDVLPPRTMGNIFEFLEGTKKLREPFVEFIKELVADSRYPKVSCIVSDTILSWVSEVCDSFSVPWIPYYPLPASSLIINHHVPSLAAQGLLPLKQDVAYNEDDVLEVPDLLLMHPLEMPMVFLNPKDTDQAVAMELRHLGLKAPWLFVNTCETLENKHLETLKNYGYNVIPVAPLLPESFLEDNMNALDKNSLMTGSLWEQDQSCIQWLDEQEPSSVMYISFGSISGMSFGDFDKILDGIILAQVKFIWVLRTDLVLGMDEERYQVFVKKAKCHGLVVHWGPQLRILKHPSISVFLTHCGWNSTFESICAGVPMICWPCFAEQKLNARYIEEWKVGVKLKKPVGNVRVEDVERVATEMVRGQTGRDTKQRCLEVRQACKEEFAKRSGLRAFAQSLRSFTKAKQ